MTLAHVRAIAEGETMRKNWIVAVLAMSAMMSAVGSAYAEGLEVGDSASVQGVVHFEKRFTFVPYDYCQGLRPCPQSQPYWSAVIQSPTAKFEIDQVYNEGQPRAPESLNIAGHVVRPGAVLRLQATIEYASPDYYIVGNVHDVNLVMSYVNNIDIYSFPNWSCRG